VFGMGTGVTPPP